MTQPAGVRAAVIVCVLGFLASSCVPAKIRLPEEPGTPLDGFADTFTRAAATCQAVRTLTAEISVSGKVGDQRVRGRVLAGFERPGSLRLEALAPFGSPFFILAASHGQGTLLLPRDRRVLTGAAPRQIIEALTGLDQSPEDLHALLAGCLVPAPRPVQGQSLKDNWVLVSLEGGSRAYLKQLDGIWRIVAGQLTGRTTEGTGFGVTVQYADFVQGLPTTVKVWQDSGTSGAVRAALSFGLSQVETNVAMNPAAFSVTIPPGVGPLTLDELRRSGPLAGSAPRDP
jgi:hypothetical protein